MATFDPSTSGSAEDTNGDRAEVDTDIPSDDYLVRIVWFQRRTSKAGNEYLSVKCDILSGSYANKGFFSTMSCKVSAGPVAAKWRSICKSLEIKESFEINGSQGDTDFARLFKGRPFRARIMRSDDGNYVNHDIEKTFSKETWSDNDRDAVKNLAEAMLGKSNEAEQEIKDKDDIPF